ncbi:MATE family efflux transporter [Treponema sp.]
MLIYLKIYIFMNMAQVLDTQQKTAFLGRDNLFPLLLKMGIPAAIGMLVNALYNVVDTIFVGHGVGPLAIAALSIVFPIQMIVSSLAQAIGVGSASIVSRRLGEKREADAAKTVGSAYASIAIITAVLASLVMLFKRPILGFFGASEAIMPIAMDYISVVTPGFFFFACSLSMSSLVRAEGNARASMIGMMIGALLNVALDPLFIFGFGMGVRGAAIATIISQIVSFSYFFFLYASKRTNISIRFKEIRVRWKILQEAMVLGTPAFIQSAGMSLLALIMNNSLGFYGGDQAITVYGMINRLNMLVIFPILGMAQGFQPIIGYNYGAHRYDRVRRAILVTMLTVLGISTFFYAFIMLVPRTIMGMFTSDPSTLDLSSGVIRIMILFIPLAAIQIIGSTYFQAVGRKTQSLLLGVSRQFIILMPLILILPRFFGIMGIWSSFPIADLLSTLLTSSLLIRELRHLDDKQAAHLASGS